MGHVSRKEPPVGRGRYTRKRWTPSRLRAWAAVVVLLGLALLVVSCAPSMPHMPWTPNGDDVPQSFASLGERIYRAGTDADGKAIPRSVPSMYSMMFGRAGCVNCHGTDGRGGTVSAMMASFEAPDIRWSTLASGQEDEDGHGHEPYDVATFTRAVRDGIDPEGDRLDAPMPRWRLTDSEIAALIEYLKSLD